MLLLVADATVDSSSLVVAFGAALIDFRLFPLLVIGAARISFSSVSTFVGAFAFLLLLVALVEVDISGIAELELSLLSLVVPVMGFEAAEGTTATDIGFLFVIFSSFNIFLGTDDFLFLLVGLARGGAGGLALGTTIDVFPL